MREVQVVDAMECAATVNSKYIRGLSGVAVSLFLSFLVGGSGIWDPMSEDF